MECQNNKSCDAGKGDRPRNCFSQKYRDNYDSINWVKKSVKEEYSVCYDENGIEIKNNE
jgi:hypothetical protein